MTQGQVTYILKWYYGSNVNHFWEGLFTVTLEELKQGIISGAIPVERPPVSIIETGQLPRANGGYTDYTISHGEDPFKAIECDQQWTKSNIELFEFIAAQNYDAAQLKNVLDSIQTEDHHWDWFKKTLSYSKDEYEWFYLYAEEKPQGVCLIYHPKVSALSTSNIFYVEYLAVAPWNRDCLIRKRDFLKIGSTLLTCSLRFAVTTLGLTPGLSLHSLPQARGYYEKLNMINIERENKPRLMYFELPYAEAEKLLGVA
ncbi:hypothetical protein [Aeromonas hydrophila]|uniref:hypothetical protein n=1 Tax=Aeromonas hydrophila TaxID=644 RepID=UPI001FC7EB3D|nr:hypothetical protein [Aeromonas hydrophila]